MAADYGGLDGLVDRYKEHFGGWAAKLMLVVIGLGVVSVTVSITLQWIVSPLLQWMEASRSARVGAIVLTFLFLVVGLILSIAAKVILVRARRALREARQLVDEGTKIIERNDTKMLELTALGNELRELGRQTLEIVDRNARKDS